MPAGRGEVRRLAQVFGVGGAVSSGRRCTRDMKFCHHLRDMLLGLLKLVGKLLVGAGKVFHRLSLVIRGLSVGSGSGV